MKKIILVLLAVLLFSLLAVSLSGCDRGEDVYAELEFQYSKDKDGYYVVHAEGGNTVVVPEKRNGKPVVGISLSDTHNDIDKYVISKNVNDIQPGSFLSTTNHVTVEIDKDNPYYYVKDKSVIDARTNELVYSFVKWFRIPSEVTSIGACAFAGNTYLTRAVIPDRIKSVGACAFEYCSNLEYVVFSEGVEEIGLGVFAGCVNLEACSIPASVVQLDSLFYDCNKLVEVKVHKKNPNYVVNGNCILDKRKNQLVATFGIDVVIPEGVSSMAPTALVSSARSIYIPSSFELQKYMFRYCDRLTSITFAEGFEKIEQYIMMGCPWLKKIVLPASIVEIDDKAFKDCISLTEVSFKPNSKLKTIGAYAFSGCESLRKITLPSGLLKIGKTAFLYCNSLREVVFEDVNNWYATNDANDWNNCINGISVNVSNPFKNADLFAKTQSTSDSEWSYFYKS